MGFGESTPLRSVDSNGPPLTVTYFSVGSDSLLWSWHTKLPLIQCVHSGAIYYAKQHDFDTVLQTLGLHIYLISLIICSAAKFCAAAMAHCSLIEVTGWLVLAWGWFIVECREMLWSQPKGRNVYKYVGRTPYNPKTLSKPVCPRRINGSKDSYCLLYTSPSPRD